MIGNHYNHLDATDGYIMPWLIIASPLSFGFKTIRYPTLGAAPKVDKHMTHLWGLRNGVPLDEKLYPPDVKVIVTKNAL